MTGNRERFARLGASSTLMVVTMPQKRSSLQPVSPQASNERVPSIAPSAKKNRRRSCQVPICPYIAERLKSGAIEYLDLILEYFGHIPHAGLHKRIQAVEHWSGPDQAVLHTVSVHLRSRFADRVWDDAPPGYLAALYLLASKERLWQPALPALSHDSIDFSRIVSKPHGFAIQDYPIFYSANWRIFVFWRTAMADHFLHGIELVEIEDGGRTVRTVKSSVIGLVGTAPQASAPRTATLTLGQGEASLTFTAKAPGALGNTLRVQIRAATQPEEPLAVALDTRSPGTTLIQVTLATDLDGARISTAAEVAQALMAESTIAERISVTAGGEGTGVVAATLGSRGLDGGMDEPFPFNVPVLVNNRRLAAHLGDAGTLPQALRAIQDQASPFVYVVRVPEGATLDETMNAVIGGLDPATGQLAGADAYSQARQIVHNFVGMLAAVGASLDDVMHVHVYLKDCADFAEMNRAYAEVFGAHRPARTVIGVADLPKPGARMTMDLMAYCPQAGREGEREGLPPDWL